MGLRFCFVAALALLSICIVPTSAQVPEGLTTFQEINYTFIDPSSALFGVPVASCVGAIAKLPAVVDLINAGTVTILCPEDGVFAALETSTNPFKKDIKEGNTDVLTKLFLYHIFTSFWVADPSNKVIGSSAQDLSTIVLNQELKTALGLTIYGSQKNQLIQFSETKIPLGKQLPDNATSILYSDQYLSQKVGVSVQAITGFFIPPKGSECLIAPELCPAPPVATPPATPVSPGKPPSKEPTPAPVTPSPEPAAPASAPSGAMAVSASWLLFALPLIAMLL